MPALILCGIIFIRNAWFVLPPPVFFYLGGNPEVAEYERDMVAGKYSQLKNSPR